MNYFNKIVNIKFACGCTKRGTDTHKIFVAQNKVKCVTADKQTYKYFQVIVIITNQEYNMKLCEKCWGVMHT